MPKIIPNLWFDTQGKDAAEFYCSVFPNSKIKNVTYYNEAGPRPAGTVLTVEFELDGQEYIAINGGPEFTFSEAISLMISCRRPGRDRLLLGQALRRRRGGPLWLAEGQVRPVLAGGARRHGGDAERPGSGARGPCHEGHVRHEEDRHRRPPGCGRSGLEAWRPSDAPGIGYAPREPRAYHGPGLADIPEAAITAGSPTYRERPSPRARLRTGSDITPSPPPPPGRPTSGPAAIPSRP